LKRYSSRRGGYRGYSLKGLRGYLSSELARLVREYLTSRLRYPPPPIVYKVYLPKQKSVYEAYRIPRSGGGRSSQVNVSRRYPPQPLPERAEVENPVPKQSLAAMVNDVEARLRRELARELLDKLRSELYGDLPEAVDDAEEKSEKGPRRERAEAHEQIEPVKQEMDVEEREGFDRERLEDLIDEMDGSDDEVFPPEEDIEVREEPSDSETANEGSEFDVEEDIEANEEGHEEPLEVVDAEEKALDLEPCEDAACDLLEDAGVDAGW